MFLHIINYLRTGIFPSFFSKPEGHDLVKYHALEVEAHFYGNERLLRYLHQERFLFAVKVERTYRLHRLKDGPTQSTPSGTDTVTHLIKQQARVYHCPKKIESHKADPTTCGQKCRPELGEGTISYHDEDVLHTEIDSQIHVNECVLKGDI